MEAIKTINLNKQFKDKHAVKDLNLIVKEGELYALLGVNGAGKTTTLKMLIGLLKETSGDIFILGHDMKKEENYIKSLTNISPQETAIAGFLTVKENLEFIAELYGLSKEEEKEEIEKVVEVFKLDDVLNKKTKKLSGGWMRRVSIAMALITKPKILFLDEPTLGLDVLARNDLWDIIMSLKGKVTIVLTTHYLEEVEALADMVGIMNDGSLIRTGSVEELKSQEGVDTLEKAFVKIIKECR